jgi:hypothetical protein
MVRSGEHYEYVGCIHIHTTESDGTKSLEEVAELASQLDLDFILISDHMTLKARDEGKERFFGKTLVLVGYEHNDLEDCNHYLIFGLEKVLPADLKASEYVALAKKAGALGIIAHPDEIRPRLGKYPSYPWLAWDADGFDAIEIWNQMSEWMENLKPYNKIKMVFSPRRFMRSPTGRILQKWDDLNRRRKVAGLGAIDVHGFPYKIGPLRITIFPYKVQFKSLRTHILISEPLSRDIAIAGCQVYDAIRDCRVFVSNYRWGDAAGFRFQAENDNQSAIAGGSLPSCDGAVIYAFSPDIATIRIVHDGRIIYEEKGRELKFMPRKNGIYRAEVYKGDRGWIFSNHIRIGR